ncbi:unnamed protein product, partial [marine sediment metagenome]
MENSGYALYFRTIVEDAGMGEFFRRAFSEGESEYSLELLEKTAIVKNGSFESGTLEGWTAKGEAFIGQPVRGDTSAKRGKPAEPERR